MDLKGLREQFVQSRERVRHFALAHTGQMTERQKSNGLWVPVRWQILCTEAAQFYTQLIAELDAGTYVQQYHGMEGT